MGGALVMAVVLGGLLTWQAVPARAASSGLVGYWKFDEGTAGLTAVDSGSNGNNLNAVDSPAPVTDIPSSMNTAISDTHSASFNGSTQYFFVPDNSSFDDTSAVSVSAWVKFGSVSGNQTIAAKWQVGVKQQWVLQAMDNKITWWTGDGGTGGADELISNATVTTGTWYHLVATATNGSKQLYINGALDNSDTAGTMGNASGVPFTVGSKQDSDGSYFEYLNGDVDDLRVYSRTLSSTEAGALASGNESSVLTGGSAVTNEINNSSTISDLQVASTAPTVYVKLFVSHGTITLGTITGLTFYNSQGTSLGNSQPLNSSILHIGGTLADVNTALVTLQYTRTDAGTGTDTLSASLVQPGQVFFSGNNHLYQYVAGPVSWSAAKSAADASTLDGAAGYLATITSQAENDFIQTQLKSDSWIGASDAAVEGAWKWVDGPENGQQFWSGNGSGSVVNSMYAHWDNPTTGGSGAEPNNSGGNENCAEFYYSNNGLWNDLPCTNTLGYIIEYGSSGDLPAVSSLDVSISTVDTTPPTTPGVPELASPTTDTTPTATWTASTDSGSGLANPAYTLQWSTSPTLATITGSIATNSTSAAPPAGLADGTWYFRVVAADASGNTADSDISGMIVDTTGPSTPGTPGTTTPTASSKPSWTWTASTDNNSGLTNPAYTVRWSQDSTFGGGVSTATSNTASFTQPGNLADGTWYFEVRATDLAGNDSSYSAAGSVVIDTTAPSMPGTPTGPASPTNDNTPTYSWTASSDAGSGLASLAYDVEWSQDTAFSGLGGIAGIADSSYTIPDSLKMADGTWYFRVQAVDAAGNTSGWSAYATVVIDTSLPAVTDIAVPLVTDTSATITWTTDKQSSTAVDYGTSGAYGAQTAETDTSPRVTAHRVILAGLVACTVYYIDVHSTDSIGNVGSGNGTFITTGCAGSAAVTAHSEVSIARASGGDVVFGGNLTLHVPADFAGTDADFQIKQLASAAALKATGWPTGVRPAGDAVYDIKAYQDAATTITSFAHPVTVTMKYTDADIAALLESSLKIYRWDDGQGWRALDSCRIDASAKTVTCTTPGFSTFALFGAAAAQQTASTGAAAEGAAVKPAGNTTAGQTAGSPAAPPQEVSTAVPPNPAGGHPAVRTESSTGTRSKRSAFLGLGWWWLAVITIAAATAWWLAVAKRRKHQAADGSDGGKKFM